MDGQTSNGCRADTCAGHHTASRHQALRELSQVLDRLDQAERRAQAVEMAATLRDVAHCHEALAMPEAAAWYFQRALAWARQVPGPCTTIDALCDAAEAQLTLAAAAGDHHERHVALEQARDLAYEAAVLSHRSADAHCEAATLLRASRILQSCGDDGDAQALSAQARKLLAADAAAASTPDRLLSPQ